MKIAFFDSGIGGISVLHQALKLMPNEDYLYYADTDHVPYGTKEKSQVKAYILKAVDFILQNDVKALVVACNTATSVAINTLRERYAIPILGMEPAVKPAVRRIQNGDIKKRILVTATPMTLKEDKLHQLLNQWDQGHIVDLLPLPELVNLAEAGEFADKAVRNYLDSAFSELDLHAYCTVVLGCTHFNFFKDTISSYLEEGASIIDGSLGTVCYLERILYEHHLKEHNQGKIEFYTSGRLVCDEREKQKYHNLLKRLDYLDSLI